MELTREQEIEERLEAATPGPWDVLPGFTDVGYADMEITRHCDLDNIAIGYPHDERNKADADLIVNAQSDLRYLLTENARLRSELRAKEGK